MGARALALNPPSCRSEALALGLLLYDDCRPCKRGHASVRYSNTGKCRQCELDRVAQWQSDNPERVRERNATNYRKNREHIISGVAKWALENPEKRRKICDRWLHANPQKRKAASEKYRQANLEELRAKEAQWRLNNRATVRAGRMQYIANKLQRTPAWADLNAIKAVYKNCPLGMHVDHIIPLRGKTVSGLHVHYNLQYLTPTENFRKQNKLLLDS